MSLNAWLLLSCLPLYFICDRRRQPIVATMSVGIFAVIAIPLSGGWAYIQHASVEICILITIIHTKSPIYYKLLISTALLAHLTMYFSWHTGYLFYFLNPIYKPYLLPTIYVIFMLCLTYTERALFTWWPPEKTKKRVKDGRIGANR